MAIAVTMALPRPAAPSTATNPRAMHRKPRWILAKTSAHALLSLGLWTTANLLPYQPLMNDGSADWAVALFLVANFVVMLGMSANPAAWQAVILADKSHLYGRLRSRAIVRTGLLYACVQQLPTTLAILCFGFPLPFACLIPATLWVLFLPIAGGIFLVPSRTWSVGAQSASSHLTRLLCSIMLKLSHTATATVNSNELVHILGTPTPAHVGKLAVYMATTALAWAMVTLFYGAFVALTDYPALQVTVVFLFQIGLGFFRMLRSHYLLRIVPPGCLQSARKAWLLRFASYFDFELCGAMFVGLSMPTIGSWKSGLVFITCDALGLVASLVYFFATGGLHSNGRFLRVDTEAMLIQLFLGRPTVIMRTADDVHKPSLQRPLPQLVSFGCKVSRPANQRGSLLLSPAVAQKSSVMLPIIITTPIVAPAESGSFSLMLMSRAPGTLQQGPDLSIDAHPLSPASLRRSGHLEKLGDTTQPSLPQLPPAEPSTTITRRGSLVLTASRTQVGSLARRPSLVPSIMSQKWRNSSTLRRTVQVSMPSPSVILQLCLETFFLDLVVRIFSGLYFFMYILPITQYQWMLDWNPTVAFAYRPSPDSIDPVSESLLYMILHVLISGVFAVAVHFVSRRSTGIGLLDHARELLQHPEVCLVVIGSFYMAPSFVAPGKHWNFLSFFYEIVTTRLRTEHGIGDGIPS